MSLKDKLMAKSAGIKEQVDAELTRSPTKPSAARTAIGHAGAYQVEITKSEARIKELESRVADLENTVIRVDEVSPNPWQPRRVFDQGELEKLASSIAEIQLIQPIIVRRVQNLDTGVGEKASVQILDTHYQLIAGERRWRAHKLLGRHEIKAVILDGVTDADMAAMALAENIDREDLSAYEIAIAIRNAESSFPNRKSLAAALGMQRSDLYRYLSFFELPDFIKVDLDSNPGLLGRDAAEAIVSMIKRHDVLAVESVSRIWTRVKSGDLDQGKFAATIEAAILRGDAPKTDRDIRKLFVGKDQAGSITRDANHLAIKIKVAALTPEKEVELRAFVERMLG